MRRLHSKILASFFILAPICTLPISACKYRAEKESRVKVVNGTVVNENGFPAVVRIIFELSSTRSAECTATWVSDRTLLTAAHCVEGADRSPGKLSVSVGTGIGQRAVKVISHPTYRPGCGDCNDIAIAIFKENTSPFYIPVALTQAQVGDPLTIVGFGKFDHLNDKSGGTKRKGTNKVSAIDYQGRVDFVGLISPINDGTGENVTNSQGDSGGPMIIKSRVQGVSSSVNGVANSKNVGHYESVRAPAISNWLTKLASSGVYILGFSAGTESMAATDTTVNGDGTDEAVAPPSPSDNDEVAPPPPQVEPNEPIDPSTPDPQPAPKPVPNPVPNPAPQPVPTPAPGGSTLLDCNRDYGKIRQGGQGVCQNSSSGFCYRYSGGDVRYSEGRTNCAASGSPGGTTPGVTPTPQPSTLLDCNGNYSQIRAGGSGVCRNRTSGFCYRYSGGDVRYSLGRVSCP